MSAPRLTRHGTAPRAGLVHLGLGAFFRAHGAQMIEESMTAAGGDWGIIGVSPRSPSTRDRLAPQDFAYTAVEMRPEGWTRRVIEILTDVMFAPGDPEVLLEQMANPVIKIVSLTVTEKGYCHVPSTGGLNHDHPDIQHDIENRLPKSAVGYLVRALERRHARGHRPFTVLSCDNLPDNGQVARNVVVGLAAAINPALAKWIEAEGRFPATMVDRIVPATTPADVEALEQRSGHVDLAPVFHEPFRQWVIENDFVDGVRPAFEGIAGVQLVKDVASFELMKVRMLNGTHSSLAYLGYLAGHETIADAVADPVFRNFALGLWMREIIPTLTPADGVDLGQYAHALLARYSNTAIRHRTWQIAMDGSQKLPQRILGTIADNLTAGRSSRGLILAVAGWMRYVGGIDEVGQPIEVKDPLAAHLRELSDSTDDPGEKVQHLLGVESIFGPSMDGSFKDEVTKAYRLLVDRGARAACETTSA